VLPQVARDKKMTADSNSFKATNNASGLTGWGGAPDDLLSEALRLYDAGDFEGTTRCCQTILANEPGNPAAHHLLGRVQIEAGHAGRAGSEGNARIGRGIGSLGNVAGDERGICRAHGAKELTRIEYFQLLI